MGKHGSMNYFKTVSATLDLYKLAAKPLRLDAPCSENKGKSIGINKTKFLEFLPRSALKYET